MTDYDNIHWAREINPFWALHDDLRITDAAALVAGIEPTMVVWRVDRTLVADNVHSEGLLSSEGVAEINTVALALANAVRKGEIKAKPAFTDWYAEEPEVTDWENTTISRESLGAWLQSRHFPSPFFGVESEGKPAYLDRDHERYSPKLAAAVRAWEALEDEELWSGQSPKSGATQWLKSHYKELDLVTTDRETGKTQMNRTGIEQAAAVVNWRPQGGSPKTPGGD